MPKATNELPNKSSAKAEEKKSRISKDARVDFELTDEELEDVSGASGSPYCNIPQQKKNFALLAVRQRMENLAEEIFGSTVAGRSAFCSGLAPRGTWRHFSAVCRAIDQFGGARCPSLVSVATLLCWLIMNRLTLPLREFRINLLALLPTP